MTDRTLSPEAPAREGGDVPRDEKGRTAFEIIADCNRESMMRRAGVKDQSREPLLGPPSDMAVSRILLAERPEIDREAADLLAIKINDALSALTPRHEAPAEPVSDHYKFDDEIAWLREAARYFSARDTNGEDRAHWANVYNAENARKLADRLAELSSNPCQLEAPAEGAGDGMDAYTRPDTIAALRARSSAPEAREGERGKSRGQVAYEGWSQGLPGCEWGNQTATQKRAWELSANAVLLASPAPSADKLRIVVAALEPFANLGVTSGPDDDPCHYAYRITRGAIRNARQALAALKAEGAK